LEILKKFKLKYPHLVLRLKIAEKHLTSYVNIPKIVCEMIGLKCRISSFFEGRIRGSNKYRSDGGRRG
jgi:hypothetical protein